MTTHPHSSDPDAGSKQDRKNRSDVTGIPSAIGHPFAPMGHYPPMVHHAPIQGLSTHHKKISCPACSRSIKWNGMPVTFTCQGCKNTIDGALLPS